jgi:polysaccharide export outer membrane protein
MNRTSPRNVSTCGLVLAFLAAVPLAAQNGVEEVAQRAAVAKVRPGDRISLRFLRDQQLSGSMSVNERGEAVFPKLGSVGVTHLTIAELPDSLRQRYREYLREPEVDVSVLRRIVVNGEVKAPGIYYLEITSSLRDAIAGAGGLLETGNRRNVVIVRGSNRTKVKNWDRLQGPETDLMSGDQIVVGRQPWLVLNALPVISTSVIVIGLIRSLRN